jgi:hypothetical protein
MAGPSLAGNEIEAETRRLGDAYRRIAVEIDVAEERIYAASGPRR